MAGSVPTLKPLLFQYSLYSFIAYSSIAPSAAPIEVPPGTDRSPATPLATPLLGTQIGSLKHLKKNCWKKVYPDLDFYILKPKIAGK